MSCTNLSLGRQFVFCKQSLLENTTIFRSRGVYVLNVRYFALRNIIIMIMHDPEISLANLHGYCK